MEKEIFKKTSKKISKGKNKIIHEIKTLLHVCPNCKKGTLKTILIFNKYRPPPLELIEQLKNQT